MDAKELHELLSKHLKLQIELNGLRYAMSKLEAKIVKADVRQIRFDGMHLPAYSFPFGGTLNRIDFVDHSPVIKFRLGDNYNLDTRGYPKLLDENGIPIEEE